MSRKSAKTQKDTNTFLTAEVDRGGGMTFLAKSRRRKGIISIKRFTARERRGRKYLSQKRKSAKNKIIAERAKGAKTVS